MGGAYVAGTLVPVVGVRTSHSTTSFASSVQPPERAQIGALFHVGVLLSIGVAYVIGAICTVVVGVVSSSFFGFMLGALVIFGIPAAAIYIYARKSREVATYNREKFEPALVAWQKSWICRRCGHRFFA